MWSLGVIFYLLFALLNELTARLRGRLPFDGNKQEDIIKAIVTGQPDYNNSAFINLSYNVLSSFWPNHACSAEKPSKDCFRRTRTCDSPRRI